VKRRGGEDDRRRAARRGGPLESERRRASERPGATSKTKQRLSNLDSPQPTPTCAVPVAAHQATQRDIRRLNAGKKEWRQIGTPHDFQQFQSINATTTTTTTTAAYIFKRAKAMLTACMDV